MYGLCFCCIWNSRRKSIGKGSYGIVCVGCSCIWNCGGLSGSEGSN